MAPKLWGNWQTCASLGLRAPLASVQPTVEGRYRSSFSHTPPYEQAPDARVGAQGKGMGAGEVEAGRQVKSAETSAKASRS